MYTLIYILINFSFFFSNSIISEMDNSICTICTIFAHFIKYQMKLYHLKKKPSTFLFLILKKVNLLIRSKSSIYVLKNLLFCKTHFEMHFMCSRKFLLKGLF